MKNHYSFDVGSSDFLSRMERVAKSFNHNIFMYAVIHKNFPIDKMKIQLEDIEVRTGIMRHEYDLLNNYQDTFVNSIFTKNNELYSCTLQICRKIRRSIVSIKNITDQYSDSLPKEKFRGRNRDVKVPLLGYSFVSSDTYSLYMYEEKEDEGSDLLSKLYGAMKTYFDTWAKLVHLCQDIIKRVEDIRQDPNYCNYLYQNQEEIWLRDNSDSQGLLCLTQEANNLPIIVLYNRYGTVNPQCAQKLYHNFNESEGHILFRKSIDDKKKLRGMDDIEILNFGNDISLALEARRVIANFDNISPKGHKKLDAKFVAVFMMKYINMDRCNEKKFINEYFYRYYNGNREHVDYSSINFQKGHMDRDTYNEYSSIIDNFIKRDNNILGANNKLGVKIPICS